MIRILAILALSFFVRLGYTQTLPQSYNLDVDCNSVEPQIEILTKFKVEYIPLESITGSYIKRIEKVVYENDKILIWDKRQNAIFLFNKKGKFIKRCKSVAHPGPGEFTYCYDIDIESSCIYLLSFKKILVYDIDFDFVKSIPLPNAYEKFIVNKNWGYLYNHDQSSFDREKVGSINLDEPNEYHQLLIENRQLGTFNLVNPINFSKKHNKVNFSYPFCDTVYQLIKDKAQPLFQLNFKGRKYPRKAFNDITNYSGGAMKLMQDLQSKRLAFWPTDLVLNNHFLFFSFILDGNFHYFYKNHSNSIQFLTSNITIDGKKITPVVNGMNDTQLIISINPWELSDKLRINLQKQGNKIMEDSNPILLLMSDL